MSHLSRRYGITEKDYARLMRMGKGACWVCGRPPKTRRLHVDHDHSLGRVREAVRGLLCWPCNRAIGYLRDDPVKAETIAAYLRREKPLCRKKRR